MGARSNFCKGEGELKKKAPHITIKTPHKEKIVSHMEKKPPPKETECPPHVPTHALPAPLRAPMFPCDILVTFDPQKALHGSDDGTRIEGFIYHDRYDYIKYSFI